MLSTHLEIVPGDDYKLVDKRALSWTSQYWPNLAGATLTMIVGHVSGSVFGDSPQVWTGTVPSSPPSPSTVSLDVASAQTALLAGGQYDYTLTATLADGNKATLAAGALSVIPVPNAPIPPSV